MTRSIILAALAIALTACGAPAPAHPAAAAGVPVPAAEPAPVRPVGISIPKIDAHSSLVKTGLNPDGSPEVPPIDQPEQASWYGYGPAPGETGPAVVLGHVNGSGRPGVFARLGELADGDHIVIELSDGERVEFTVYDIQRAPKAEFPFARVFSDTEGPELRLITCGGAFDGEHYSDNVIVYARR